MQGVRDSDLSAWESQFNKCMPRAYHMMVGPVDMVLNKIEAICALEQGSSSGGVGSRE